MNTKYDEILLKVQKNIKKRALLHDNDPSIDKYWHLISAELIQDVNLTIYILENASRDEFEYYTEVFENISMSLRSEVFLNYLKRAQDKYPDIYLGAEIAYAQSCINN